MRTMMIATWLSAVVLCCTGVALGQSVGASVGQESGSSVSASVSGQGGAAVNPIVTGLAAQAYGARGAGLSGSASPNLSEARPQAAAVAGDGIRTSLGSPFNAERQSGSRSSGLSGYGLAGGRMKSGSAGGRAVGRRSLLTAQEAAALRMYRTSAGNRLPGGSAATAEGMAARGLSAEGQAGTGHMGSSAGSASYTTDFPDSTKGTALVSPPDPGTFSPLDWSPGLSFAPSDFEARQFLSPSLHVAKRSGKRTGRGTGRGRGERASASRQRQGALGGLSSSETLLDMQPDLGLTDSDSLTLPDSLLTSFGQSSSGSIDQQ